MFSKTILPKNVLCYWNYTCYTLIVPNNFVLDCTIVPNALYLCVCYQWNEIFKVLGFAFCRSVVNWWDYIIFDLSSEVVEHSLLSIIMFSDIVLKVSQKLFNFNSMKSPAMKSAVVISTKNSRVVISTNQNWCSLGWINKITISRSYM